MNKQYVNFIGLRVIIKEDNNKDELLNGLKSLVPFDFEKEKLKLKCHTDKVLDFDPISTYEIELKRKKHISVFLEFLFEKLSKKDIETLKDQIDSRLDKGCFYYLRLDRKNVLEGKFVLTESGDCFHIRMSIAAYPTRKSRGLEIVNEMFEEYDKK